MDYHFEVVERKKMRKIFLGIMFIFITLTSAQAYMIGGAYASLVSCTWGQYGYQYGNIGTYNVNGQIYQIFFGSNYCQY